MEETPFKHIVTFAKDDQSSAILTQLTRIANALEAGNILYREWTDVQMQWRDEDTLNVERNYAMNMDWIEWQKKQKQEEWQFIATQNAITRNHEKQMFEMSRVKENSLERLVGRRDNEEPRD